MAARPVLFFIIVAAVAAKPRPLAAEPLLIIVAAVAAEAVGVAAESLLAAVAVVALLSEIRPCDRRLYCPSRFAQASGEWRVC